MSNEPILFDRRPDPDREWINAHLRDHVGRFLDIGAFDGYNSSLTYDLVRAGWSGVLVEPNPTHFNALLKLHRSNPRLHLVHAALARCAGLTMFWDDPRGEVSTLDPHWRDRFAVDYGTLYFGYHVATVTPDELLQAFGGPRNWQFVNVDAEGVSIELALMLPLDAMIDTEVICVEWDVKGLSGSPGKTDLLNCLQPYYDVVLQNSTNVLARRRA